MKEEKKSCIFINISEKKKIFLSKKNTNTCISSSIKEIFQYQKKLSENLRAINFYIWTMITR